MFKEKTKLEESSINRLMAHNEEHDCAVITAFRGENTKQKNLALNSALGRIMRDLGYGTTKVIGSYQEEGMEKADEEVSWFVVNVNDDANFLDNIADLAEKDNQDSILVIPKGKFKSGECFLYGTKKDGEWVKYHEKKPTEGLHLNGKDVFFTRIKGKKFAFQLIESCEEVLSENYGSYNNALVIHSYVKNHYGHTMKKH